VLLPLACNMRTPIVSFSSFSFCLTTLFQFFLKLFGCLFGAQTLALMTFDPMPLGMTKICIFSIGGICLGINYLVFKETKWYK